VSQKRVYPLFRNRGVTTTLQGIISKNSDETVQRGETGMKGLSPRRKVVKRVKDAIGLLSKLDFKDFRKDECILTATRKLEELLTLLKIENGGSV
jgi:hypothetical protein